MISQYRKSTYHNKLEFKSWIKGKQIDGVPYTYWQCTKHFTLNITVLTRNVTQQLRKYFTTLVVPSRATTVLHSYHWLDSLVKQLKAGLTHTHFLLDSKLGNGRILGRTLATENLATGSTVVLEKHRTQIEVNFHTCATDSRTHSCNWMKETIKSKRGLVKEKAWSTFLVITPNWTLHRWHSSASTQSGA